MSFNHNYPTVDYLKEKTAKRIPHFAYDYLRSGCSDERALRRTTGEFDGVLLQEHFVRPVIKQPDIKASFCGLKYDMPFGVAPIGLQGLMWPDAPLHLARSAKKYNIPYILSTLSSHSIEEVAKASEGEALFQLYNPDDADIQKDIMRRVKESQYRALIVTADIASFGYRARDIKNGLAMPPRMTAHNIWEILTHPAWALNMLVAGVPRMRTLLPYMESGSMQGMAQFVNDKMMGGVSMEQLKILRDMWDGPFIVKGVLGEPDMEKCIQAGVDGVIVSNHGGRQLDAGQTAISVLPSLVKKYGKKVHISFDSGIRSGTDIACALASGAEMTFSGRPFVYGVSAIGKKGGDHVAEMFQKQLEQAMCQIGCDKISDLPKFLVK